MVRDDGAVLFDTHPEPEDLRVPGARHEELLVARVLQLDGPVRGEGERGADVLDHHFLLAAEAAADPRLDHAHPAHRDLQDHRHLAAHVERDLGAGADHQPVVGVEPADDDMRLDGGVLLPRRPVFTLQDQVRLLEPLRDVAQLPVDVARQVPGGVLDAGRVRLVVDHGGAAVHRVLHVEHRGQHLVLDLDAP